jgi:hypothetical protein
LVGRSAGLDIADFHAGFAIVGGCFAAPNAQVGASLSEDERGKGERKSDDDRR